MPSIAGQAESVRILEYNGKSYIGLDDLARLIDGSLSFAANQFAANQVVLTLPVVDQATGPPPTRSGFSKGS
jgi:hypothetical protein